MRKLFHLIVFIFLIVPAVAQRTIKGMIKNADTKKPLAAASVYINNTSMGVISKEDGSFILSGVSQEKIMLIVSSVGYLTIAKEIDAREGKEIIIELRQAPEILQSLDISPPIPNGWVKWGDLFTKIFIGTSPLAFTCQIMNPEVIKFREVERETLVVYATKPIEIKNSALGYDISYTLEEFEYNLTTKIVSYNGYAFFTDLALLHSGKAAKWEERRKETYNGSLMHFMRSFFTNHLQAEGFEMRSLALISNTEKDRAKYLFSIHKDSILLDTVSIVTDQLTQASGDGTPVLNPSIKRTVNTRDSSKYYKNALKEPDSIISNSVVNADTIGFMIDSLTAGFYYPDSLQVTYNLKPTLKAYRSFSKHKNEEFPQSQFVFPNKKPIAIQSNGFFYGPHDLRITGFWAWWETMATMLPYDYLPANER